MPRIVPGQSPSAPDFGAVLRGFEKGSKLRLAEEESNRRDRHLMMQFAEAQAEYAREEAEALRKHQQGARDAKALAAWGALSQRSQQDPKAAARMRRAQMAGGALSKLAERGVSEDAIQRILGHVKGAEDGIQRQETAQEAQGAIQSAMQDGVTDEAGAQLYAQRMQAGENPAGILQELQQARIKRSTAAANAEKSMEALTKAQALVQASPPGRQRDLATTFLKEYEMSPSVQEKPDSGAKLLQSVSQTLLGSQEQYDEAQELAEASAQAKREAMFNTQPMPGLGGTTGEEMRAELEGSGVPKVGGDLSTVPGSRATRKSGKRGGGKPVDPKRATLEVIGSVADEKELLAALKERGVRFDAESAAAVREAIAEWRQRAAPGADR